MQRHNRPVPQADEVAIDHIVVLQQREDIAVDDLGADDDRAALVTLQSLDPLFVTLCRLELESRGRRLHVLLEVAAHGPQVTPKHLLHHLDQLVILLLALRPYARALAVTYMILEADAVTAPRHGLRREIELACAQRNDLAYEFEDRVLHRHRPVGPEILRSVVPQLPRRLHTREGLAADDDPRICLVVLEKDVVTRLEGLDEGVFQQQRILLAVHHKVADLDDLPHQNPNLGRMVAVLHKVRRDTFAQRFGLAYIYNGTVFVEELIYLGESGNAATCALSVSCCWLMNAKVLKVDAQDKRTGDFRTAGPLKAPARHDLVDTPVEGLARQVVHDLAAETYAYAPCAETIARKVAVVIPLAAPQTAAVTREGHTPELP